MRITLTFQDLFVVRQFGPSHEVDVATLIQRLNPTDVGQGPIHRHRTLTAVVTLLRIGQLLIDKVPQGLGDISNGPLPGRQKLSWDFYVRTKG